MSPLDAMVMVKVPWRGHLDHMSCPHLLALFWGTACGLGALRAEEKPILYCIPEIEPDFPRPGSVKIGFIDKTGAVIVPLTSDIIDGTGAKSSTIDLFHEGLQPVEVGLKTKWPPFSFGYLDTSGKFAIEPQYGLATDFSEGLAAVRGKDGYGYIDHSGKLVIPMQFDYAGPFHDGAAVVTKKGDWLRSIIDRTGRLVVESAYPSADTFSEGLLCVSKYVIPRTSPPGGGDNRDMLWAFVDPQGRRMIDYKFKDPSSFSKGLAAINEDHGCGYIDKTGAYAIAPQFFMGWNFTEGVARVKTKDGKMGYIDKTGTILFTVPKVTWAEPFQEGLACAAIMERPGKRLYGFIDHKGAWVIPPQFEMATPFCGGLSRVYLKGVAGYINTKGVYIWKTTLPNSPFLPPH